MPKLQITDAAAKRLKAKPGQDQTDYFDAGFPGLALRVSKQARKTWTYFYRYNGKQKRLTLDLYPSMTVEAAHDAWRVARDEVRQGRDPAGTPSSAQPASTAFECVFEDWLKRDQAGNRSAKIQRRSIEKDVLPHWRGREIGTIDKRACLDVLDALVDAGKPIAARRLHARLHRLFQWAMSRDIAGVVVNPLAAAAKPGKDVARERALSDDELKRVWNAAERLGYPYGKAFQLLILTGARREEICGLRWSERVNGFCKLPSERTKNKRPHLVHLSTPARAILDELPKVGDLVFVTPGGSTLGGMWSRKKLELDTLAGVTGWHVHDLRRTAAVGLQRLGTPLPVTETILGHAGGSRGGIVGVYQTHTYEAEAAGALEAWGAHVMALVHGSVRGQVVPLRA
jgi:integrase